MTLNEFLILLNRLDNLNVKEKKRFNELRGKVIILNKEKRILDPKLKFRLNFINEEFNKINKELRELLISEKKEE